MSPLEIATFLIILMIGVIAPLLVEITPKLRMPVVVLEIGLGILVGPQVLGLAKVGPVIDVLSNMGLAFLFFLAGFEIDFNKIRGRPLKLGVLGWLMSLGIALTLGFILQKAGIIVSDVVVSVAVATTAFGTLLPILHDQGELDTPFGRFLMAIGIIGELGPIVLISIMLTREHSGSIGAALFLIIFSLIAIVVGFLASRVRPDSLIHIFRKRMHGTAQLPLRASILILAVLVLLTGEFGLDSILGALAAGVVVKLAAAGEKEEVLRKKLEGVGYGVFVPIFFIATGMKFDLQALLTSPTGLLHLPIFLLLFLAVRGLPVLLYRKDLPRSDLIPLALFSATTLPLVVAVTDIGVAAGRMRPENAAALVGAGMVSVFCFPLIAMLLRYRNRARETQLEAKN